MPHKLYRLLEGVYNSPHLVTQQALQPIVEYLQRRNSDPSFAIVADAKKVEKKLPELVQDVGEIVIDSVITYKPVDGLCGPTGTSYQGILEQANELIEAGCKTLILTFASPGGSAQHCFSTCQDLRDMCDENGVKLISYIDEQAASSALALSVVADEVIIHPSASTGSIGCVCAIMDYSKAMEMAGVKPIYVTSTPGKTPFNESGSFSESFLTSLQEDVTRLGSEFAAHVHKYTGIPVEDILAMDAKMFHAERALELGLVNSIMDHKQFSKYIADMQKERKRA